MKKKQIKKTANLGPKKPVGRPKKKPAQAMPIPCLPQAPIPEEKADINVLLREEKDSVCPICFDSFLNPGALAAHMQNCDGYLGDPGYKPSSPSSQISTENIPKEQKTEETGLAYESIENAIKSFTDFLTSKLGPHWKTSKSEIESMARGWKPVADFYFKKQSNKLFVGALIPTALWGVPRGIADADARAGRAGNTPNSGEIRKRKDNPDAAIHERNQETDSL